MEKNVIRRFKFSYWYEKIVFEKWLFKYEFQRNLNISFSTQLKKKYSKVHKDWIIVKGIVHLILQGKY